MARNTVCAIVVTYNRKGLLLECLRSLARQTFPLDAIFCIDNASTDGTGLTLFREKFIGSRRIQDDENMCTQVSYITAGKRKGGAKIRFEYIRMPENTGGAGGFHEGLKRAVGHGFDWMWLMDDDAEPEPDSLSRLGEYFTIPGIAALAGTVINAQGDILVNHRGHFSFSAPFPKMKIPVKIEGYGKDCLQIDMASFVGILARGTAVQSAGLPRKEFFIHHDDLEFCIRLRRYGDIVLVPGSRIIHKERAEDDTQIKKFLFWKYKLIPFEKIWIDYFQRRNSIWLGKMYSPNRASFYVGAARRFLQTIIGICLYNDRKVRRMHLTVAAYLDGFRGEFDNKKPKKLQCKSS
jgi:rhamnopyranosyl-N-acetylglucosaminyl-diphospho-decaprenol beta-1,3/1,4-galactofuranosyltransferase